MNRIFFKNYLRDARSRRRGLETMHSIRRSILRAGGNTPSSIAKEMPNACCISAGHDGRGPTVNLLVDIVPSSPAGPERHYEQRQRATHVQPSPKHRLFLKLLSHSARHHAACTIFLVGITEKPAAMGTSLLANSAASASRVVPHLA